MAQSLPGGLLQPDPAPTRRLQRDSSHRLLRLLPARWSQPGRPRALARKWEAGGVRGGENIWAEVGVRAHLQPQARSSAHKTDRHWGRSPSASRPTWAPLPPGASRPPRPAHCAGACGGARLDSREGGGVGRQQPIPGRVPPPQLPRPESGKTEVRDSGVWEAGKRGAAPCSFERENTFLHCLSNLESSSLLIRDAASVSQDPATAPPLLQDGHVMPEVGGGNMVAFPAGPGC